MEQSVFHQLSFVSQAWQYAKIRTLILFKFNLTLMLNESVALCNVHCIAYIAFFVFLTEERCYYVC